MLPAIRNNAPVAHQPVNRLASFFDRFFDNGFLAPPPAPAWTDLPLSAWEDEEAYHVEADLPGVDDKDVEVSIHQGMMVIRGERRSERPEAGSRSYGRFEQRLMLPAPVDPDKVEAKLARGVLTVKAPKAEEAKPRRIALKSE